MQHICAAVYRKSTGQLRHDTRIKTFEHPFLPAILGLSLKKSTGSLPENFLRYRCLRRSLPEMIISAQTLSWVEVPVVFSGAGDHTGEQSLMVTDIYS